METLISVSNDELEIIFSELEKKGLRFSTDDIVKILEIDEDRAVTIRRLLTYIIPKVKENPESIKKELISAGLNGQKIDFLTEKALALKEETYQACEIIFKLYEYLSTQSHIGEIISDLNFAPIRSNKGKQIMLLPIVKMKIMTHPGTEEAVPEHISVTLNTKQLQMMIDNLRRLLSRVQADTTQLQNLLGNKAIINLGEE
jgi:hypothetical protein